MSDVHVKQPELGETAFRQIADRVEIRDALMANAIRRSLDALGVDGPDPREFGFGEETSEAVHCLDRLDAQVWREPHALGWMHQYLGEAARQQSFAEHTGAEAKHASASISTQLYTPRWIADLMIERSLELSGSDVTVLDPACGGGQMLLAAVDALVARGVDAGEALCRVRGRDLDAEAARVTRAALGIHAVRLLGELPAEIAGEIERNVVAGDSLFEDVEAAEVVITNPPYMGSRSMPRKLKERLRARYAPFHADLYAAFIDRCVRLSRRVVAILAQQTLWFLARFERARRDLRERVHLDTFVHLGPHAFSALSGEKACVVAFVAQACEGEEHGGAARFFDLRKASHKHVAYRRATPRRIALSEFDAIEGAPLAHWLPTSLRRHFKGTGRLEDLVDIPGSQNKTGNNRRFVRRWQDVPDEEIQRAPGLSPRGVPDGRWVYYSKGGRYAPWWGNWDWVVDWSDSARTFYAENRTSNLLSEKYWFRRGICYTDFGGSSFNARWMPPGCVFDMTGPAIFVKDDDEEQLYALLVLLNSSPVRALLNAVNPSLHYQVRDLRNLPVPRWDETLVGELAPVGRRLVELARALYRAADDPRCQDAPALDFEQFASLERRADELICALYGCPELLIADGERPRHHMFKKLEPSERAARRSAAASSSDTSSKA